MESTYNFLIFLVTVLPLGPGLYTITLNTIYSNWHFPLREQLFLLEQLNLGGVSTLNIPKFFNVTFIN